MPDCETALETRAGIPVLSPSSADGHHWMYLDDGPVERATKSPEAVRHLSGFFAAFGSLAVPQGFSIRCVIRTKRDSAFRTAAGGVARQVVAASTVARPRATPRPDRQRGDAEQRCAQPQRRPRTRRPPTDGRPDGTGLGHRSIRRTRLCGPTTRGMFTRPSDVSHEPVLDQNGVPPARNRDLHPATDGAQHEQPGAGGDAAPPRPGPATPSQPPIQLPRRHAASPSDRTVNVPSKVAPHSEHRPLRFPVRS